MKQLITNLYRFEDTCNVYVVAGEEDAIAVDFGSGAWLAEHEARGLPPVRHVFLTHHHADQCAGLLQREAWPFTVHAPPGEQPLLSPEGVAEFWRTRRDGGVPRGYAALERGIPGVAYDMDGWTDLFWGASRIRFISTPGHGPGAVSVLADVGSKQALFCGDAAHAGGTIWQPSHLEWDHWTGTGALQAWEGIERLLGLGIDLLCPSHGPVVSTGIRPMLRTLSRSLLAFYRAKGSICAGERDHYLPPRILQCGAREVLPGLYQFGANSYLLLSERGEALVIDPWSEDLDQLEPLLDELGRPAVTAGTATHYHLDHSDGLPILKQRYGAGIWLHPQVAAPLREIGALDVPWLPKEPVIADALLPQYGAWIWNEFSIRVAHFPGQTWWHCALMTTVNGQKVFFGGDNFQPPSRWNGTGGFSAFNGSHFKRGYAPSVRLILRWKPDVVACGHGTYVKFSSRYYRKVLAWAAQAGTAVRALCPAHNLHRDYYRGDLAGSWPKPGRTT